MIEYMALIKAIKQIVKEQLESEKLTDMFIGLVSSESPLEIKLSEKITLSGELLVVPEYFAKKTYSVTGADHTHTLEIDNSLKTGDVVTLLRVQNGRRFVVMGVKKNGTQ